MATTGFYFRVEILLIYQILFVFHAQGACDSALGVATSSTIPNNQMSASSWGIQHHEGKTFYFDPWKGRLGYTGCWCAHEDHQDKNQWLQIDFGNFKKITGVTTQGRWQRWVKTYYILYSLDTSTWSTYQENGTNELLTGISSGYDSQKRNNFNNPVIGRYVRFNPQSWNQYTAVLPQPPSIHSITGVNSTGCSIKFSPFDLGDGSISAIELLYKRTSDTSNTTQAIDNEDDNVTLSGLQPYTNYTVQIKLSTDLTPNGVLSNVSYFTTKGVSPNFTSIPTNKDVEIGKDITFSCSATAIPNSTISWSFSGGNLPSNSAVTPNSLTLTAVKNDPSNEGTYTCNATNNMGSIQSSAILNVFVKPSASVAAPLGTLFVGETLSLSCQVSGDPSPTVSWSKDGTTLSETSTTFTKSNIQLTDEGNYVCTATNKHGSDTAQANVAVDEKPSASVAAPPGTLFVGETLSLTCHVSGDPRPTVSWSKDGTTLSETSTTFTKSNVQLTDEGNYVCTATNKHGSDTGQANVAVDEKPSASVTAPPGTLFVGGTLSLTCQVTGDPSPTVSWSKDGTTLSETSTIFTKSNIQLTDEGNYVCTATNKHGSDTGQTSVTVDGKPSVLVTPDFLVVLVGPTLQLTCQVSGSQNTTISWSKDGNNLQQTSRVLTIPNVQLNDEGVYSCTATNKHGNDSAQARVIVDAIPVTSVTPATVNLLVGETLSLTCQVSGDPIPTVSWSKDGEDLQQKNKNVIINNVEISHEGNYTCTATNLRGTDSSRAVVYVNEPYGVPIIKEFTDISTSSCRVVCGDININSSIIILNVEYRKTSQPLFLSVSINTDCSDAVLLGLEPSTEYQVRLRLYTELYRKGRESAEKMFKTEELTSSSSSQNSNSGEVDQTLLITNISQAVIIISLLLAIVLVIFYYKRRQNGGSKQTHRHDENERTDSPVGFENIALQQIPENMETGQIYTSLIGKDQPVNQSLYQAILNPQSNTGGTGTVYESIDNYERRTAKTKSPLPSIPTNDGHNESFT